MFEPTVPREKKVPNESSGPDRDLIGYGENPPRPEFPGGANVAVNLVINYEEGSEYSHFLGDAENDSIAEVAYPFPREIRDLATESMYEYGSRVGVWRLLSLFQEYEINGTFFACARAFEMNPEVARAARARGHDLVSHGYRWEEHWRLSREEERQRILKAVESFTTTWGSGPLGWYCRYGPSVNTRELIVEHGGFLYDSDAYNDDLPYFTMVGDRRHLVVPYSLTYNDIQGTKAPGDFFEFARRGLDELWLEGARGAPKMMSIGLHPRLVGQAGRASALREFIEHCNAKGKVWFARRDDIAKLWIEQFG